ncbi:uncharacterized protein L3040_006871 [Drepanopeziza brunnea f. sp. 'multigermtubi']|nr:hypothetical protein L3040_006871 [Drepanopeziza brunnea f. sp. 'multigermtubi']
MKSPRIQPAYPWALKLKAAKVTKNSAPLLDKFTLFPKLYPELQMMVWKFGLGLSRYVNITEKYGDVEQHGLQADAQPPVLLQVCSDSRRLALRHYELCFETQIPASFILFNWEVDVLVFASPATLGEFFKTDVTISTSREDALLSTHGEVFDNLRHLIIGEKWCAVEFIPLYPLFESLESVSFDPEIFRSMSSGYCDFEGMYNHFKCRECFEEDTNEMLSKSEIITLEKGELDRLIESSKYNTAGLLKTIRPPISRHRISFWGL